MGSPLDDGTLAAFDPTGRFSDRAEDYQRFRPDYPAAAIDAVLEHLGPPGSLHAADVGAGTGISSRQLADRGVDVIAVEPNGAMRSVAALHPRVRWHDGSGEATGLDAGGLDLVLVAQAFHWFRAVDAVRELRRVLRPGGRLAVMWNHRDPEDPLTLGYIEAIHAVNGEHPAEQLPFDPNVLTREGAFADVDCVATPHAQALDLPGLIGRATSASYVPRDGARAVRLRGLLTELFERHAGPDGRVRMRYRTTVHRARRA